MCMQYSQARLVLKICTSDSSLGCRGEKSTVCTFADVDVWLTRAGKTRVCLHANWLITVLVMLGTSGRGI